MKAIVFSTSTPDTEKLIQSFTGVVKDTVVHRYDVPDFNMALIAEHVKPDVMIYIGAVTEHHHNVPTMDMLCRTNHVAPLIHICSDSADPPWWHWLNEYNTHKAFALQVGIDGCFDSPLSRYGLIALTPVDPSWFADAPWKARIYPCGFAGGGFGGGGPRGSLLAHLRDEGLLEYLNQIMGQRVPYEYFCAFYTLCFLVINHDGTGTGTKRHVKGRFVEAGLAGAIPLEPAQSPTKDWFKPGIDYLTWETPEDAARHVRDLPTKMDQHERMAKRLKAQMREKHSSPVFWKKVLERVGV